jgi:hypothetical protein
MIGSDRFDDIAFSDDVKPRPLSREKQFDAGGACRDMASILIGQRWIKIMPIGKKWSK